ncbi:MAG: SatD family protein [Oscillospiraceae bacterium]|nr:SatD family protein [Oscillospiraceae bacterium]
MYCVIVGDMINSREMTQQDRSIAGITATDVFSDVNSRFRMYLLSGFELSGGDSFEAVLTAPYKVFEILQTIIKALYPVCKVRISIVLGELYTFGEGLNTVHSIDGPAFHKASDNILKQKKNNSNHWLQLTVDTGNDAQPLVDAVITMLSVISEGWTDRQRQIVFQYELLNHDMKELSVADRISLNAVRKHLKAANYEAYRLCWSSLAAYFINMNTRISKSLDSNLSYTIPLAMACHEYDIGDLISAKTSAQEALRIATEEYGNNNYMLSHILNVLGEILLKKEEYSEAEQLLHNSISIQADYPQSNDSNLYTIYLLGKAQLLLGKIENARSTLARGKNIEVTARGVKSTHLFDWDLLLSLM